MLDIRSIRLTRSHIASANARHSQLSVILIIGFRTAAATINAGIEDVQRFSANASPCEP